MTTEMREINQRLFNCPLKTVQCSVNLIEGDFDDPAVKHGIAALKAAFRFTKDARKLFTRLIYKRVLFAKIVNLRSVEEPIYENVRGRIL